MFVDGSLKDCFLKHKEALVDGTPLLHSFDESFKALFGAKSFNVSELIFNIAGPQQKLSITYLYLLDDTVHSIITIDDQEAICAIMRLWYGIRCVSAHGVPDKTTKQGCLKDFPKCSGCQKYREDTGQKGTHQNTGQEGTTRQEEKTEETSQQLLTLSAKLCSYLDIVLNSPDRDNILRGNKDDFDDNYKEFLKIKRLPKVDVIKGFHVNETEEGEKCKKSAIELTKKYWPEIPLVKEEYPASFGFYHLYRKYDFVSSLHHGMYITYRLLVRINQFILLLAFRIKLAIAKWLSDHKDSCSERMPELKNLWGYTDNEEELKKIILEEEEEHRKKILQIKENIATSRT